MPQAWTLAAAGATNEVEISPNPSSGAIIISAIKEIKQIAVTDCLGKIVLRLDDINSKTYTANLMYLINGIYQLKVKLVDDKYTTKKIAILK